MRNPGSDPTNETTKGRYRATIDRVPDCLPSVLFSSLPLPRLIILFQERRDGTTECDRRRLAIAPAPFYVDTVHFFVIYYFQMGQHLAALWFSAGNLNPRTSRPVFFQFFLEMLVGELCSPTSISLVSYDSELKGVAV